MTTQEDDNSITPASDAHTAIEFYQFAIASDDFLELSSTMLAHLYFIKVEVKPAGYEGMDTDRKNKWDQSTMNKIRKKTKRVLIEAIMEAVHVSSQDTIHIN